MNTRRENRIPRIEQEDVSEANKRHGKRRKARAERRKAKTNPEVTPSYGRYSGSRS